MFIASVFKCSVCSLDLVGFDAVSDIVVLFWGACSGLGIAIAFEDILIR
jgi:hypothetical protein